MKPTFVTLLAAGSLILGTSCGPSGRSPTTVELKPAPFEVWSVYDGTLEARSLKSIMSKGRGAVTVEEIVPQGAFVRQGDVLVALTGDKEDVATGIFQVIQERLPGLR